MADLFVDDTNTSGSADGSRQHPYANLQAAIDAASGNAITINNLDANLVQELPALVAKLDRTLASLEAAGWASTPYVADVPSFGTWGFHLATPQGPAPRVGATEPPGTRYWDEAVASASMVLPPDVLAERRQAPSTVLDPRIVDAHQGAWFDY